MIDLFILLELHKASVHTVFLAVKIVPISKATAIYEGTTNVGLRIIPITNEVTTATPPFKGHVATIDPAEFS